MVGLAFVFSIWGFIQSEKQVLMRSFERNIGADLQVRGAFLMTKTWPSRWRLSPESKT
jgi:hypothetical protein